MKQKYVTLTPTAENYLQALLSEQGLTGMGVRIFVENPGTTDAECCMAYCREGEQEPTDKAFQHNGFTLYLDKSSVPYLKDAVLDYSLPGVNEDRTDSETTSREPEEGQLTFSAPNAKPNNPKESAMMDSFMDQYRRGLFKR